MGNLNGCVAVVTGASSGIGEAIAADLAKQGATVVATARRKDRLDAVASTSANIHAVACDVADAASVKAMVEAVVTRFGRIDILVNNAGIGLTGYATQITLEEWKEMVDVNVMGVLNCAHTALNHLIDAAKGPRGRRDGSVQRAPDASVSTLTPIPPSTVDDSHTSATETTRREPSGCRAMQTTRSIAERNCSRMAPSGRATSPISTSVSSRRMASAGPLA